MDTNEKILEVLKNSGNPMKGAEIAAAAGIDPKEVTKAIKKMKDDGLIVSPKNCYYAAK